MIQVNPPIDVKLWGAYNRGEPNKECIWLQVVSPEPINLATHVLLMGLHRDGVTAPLRDKFFWFGEFVADPGTWLLVYTSRGSQRITTTKDGKPLVISYWGYEKTQFADPSIVPILGEFFGLAIDKSPDWLTLPTTAALPNKSGS